MGEEIERKFLVRGSGWRGLALGTSYRQGYLSTVKERTVRVRTVGEKGDLTIKGAPIGPSRAEFEYEIPIDQATEIMEFLCERPLIEKTQYKIPFDELIWEVDEFHGQNKGLVLAEVELRDESQTIRLPPWAGKEVTGDPPYYNANLVKHPYSKW